MKSQVLHTVWCHIYCEAAGEFWHWSLSGVHQCTPFPLPQWHATSAGIVQFRLVQHQPVVDDGARVELAPEDDVSPRRQCVLVVTLDLRPTDESHQRGIKEKCEISKKYICASAAELSTVYALYGAMCKALAKRYSQLKPGSQLWWSWVSFHHPLG